MWSVEKSFRLYGDTISEETVAYLRCCTLFLVSVCVAGILCQIVQIPGPVPLEFVCAGIYLVYNVTAMLVIRVANIAFKFEDPTCLWLLIRIASAMAIYGIVLIVTIPTFDNETALLLMGVFGLINVLVILPTNIYEDSMMLKARSQGVGLEKAKALSCCENSIVVGFLFFANAFVMAAILLCVVILSGPNIWTPLIVVYVGMNVVPVILPKVEHLVSTEARTWPLKVLLFHFATVVMAVILIIITLSTQNSSRDVRILFGVVGTISGILVSISLVVTALRAYYKPRTAIKTTGSRTSKIQEDDIEDATHPSAT